MEVLEILEVVFFLPAPAEGEACQASTVDAEEKDPSYYYSFVITFDILNHSRIFCPCGNYGAVFRIE